MLKNCRLREQPVSLFLHGKSYSSNFRKDPCLQALSSLNLERGDYHKSIAKSSYLLKYHEVRRFEHSRQ